VLTLHRQRVWGKARTYDELAEAARAQGCRITGFRSFNPSASRLTRNVLLPILAGYGDVSIVFDPTLEDVEGESFLGEATPELEQIATVHRFDNTEWRARVGELIARGFDESLTMSARLRANQDRKCRAEWARRIAADQRLEARRAAAILQSITRQIRSIQTGGSTKLSSVGPLQGAGVVTAILPNGRRTRMRIIPTIAPISELNRLRSAMNVNDRRQAMAMAENSRAIAALAAALAATVKKLSAEQVKIDKQLGKRLVEDEKRVSRRITRELSRR
jgi:hypothetical protein